MEKKLTPLNQEISPKKLSSLKVKEGGLEKALKLSNDEVLARAIQDLIKKDSMN